MRVVAAVVDLPVEATKTLANLIQAQGRAIVLLGTGAGGKATVVFARSEDGSLHMGDLLRGSLSAFGGGGGGRPEFAQGGGVPVEKLEALVDYARQQVVQG
jgi:alanyl-tRNA synthetase